MSKTTLNEMSYLVNTHETFEGNSVFAKFVGDGKYVVYSYGYHFPMYVWDCNDQVWVGNESKYSTTTSRHQSKCRPRGDIKWVKTDEIRKFVESDKTWVQHVLLRGEAV